MLLLYSAIALALRCKCSMPALKVFWWRPEAGTRVESFPEKAAIILVLMLLGGGQFFYHVIA